MLEVLAAVGVVAVAVGFGVLMIRGVMQMWRDKERSGSISSGVAGALSELDRAIRPSVEHRLEAENSVKKKREDIGGE